MRGGKSSGGLRSKEKRETRFVGEGGSLRTQDHNCRTELLERVELKKPQPFYEGKPLRTPLLRGKRDRKSPIRTFS